MPIGDNVDKNLKILKFQTDVVDFAIGQIERDLNDIPNPHKPNVPVVSTSSLNVKPENFSSLPPPDNKSSVATRGGELTASALADLFLIYGRNLTSIRICTFSLVRQNTLGGRGIPTGTTNIASWNNRRTALSAQFAMTATAFRDAVANATPPSNPVGVLAPGALAQESAIDNLILKIRNVVAANMANATNISITVCHSACHSSCHGSRGRR